MALRITKAHEPIQMKTIKTCLYAQPGVGRTSLAFTAYKPLLLDFDNAAYRAKNRGDAVLIESWSEIEKMDQGDFAGYQTVVIDTVGRALDKLTTVVASNDPKNRTRSGGLTLQGYGALKTEFIAWLNKLLGWGLDIVLLAHLDEQRSGDDVIERLDITGGSKNEVYKVCDQMGRIYMQNGKRVLNFSPTDVAFGKNPGMFDPIELPSDPFYVKEPHFLGDIIEKAKAAINAMNAEQTAVAGLLEAWKAKVDAAKTAEEFTALIAQGKELDERIRDNGKRLLLKVAKDAGTTFDAAKGAFVGPAPANDAPSATAAPANDTTEAPAAKKTRGKKAETQSELLPTGTDMEPGSNG